MNTLGIEEYHFVIEAGTGAGGATGSDWYIYDVVGARTEVSLIRRTPIGSP